MAENEKVIVVQKTANQLFRTKRIWQYDVGHTLRFDGFTLPNTFQVHFASSPTGDSIPQIGQDGVCAVPAQFAQNSGTIYAWVYVAETDTGLTKYKIEIPVEARGAITNQEPTPVEQSAIDQAIAALNAGVTAAEAAQEAAETAQAGAETAQEQAEDAATQAANSATDANASREAADVSATNAGVSERNAMASETSAAASASAADSSASSAENSASEAAGYVQDISGAVSTAQAAAQTATTKATEASESASAAAQKAQEAASSAGSAKSSATAANTAKTAAETAKNDAISAKNDAQTAATNAASSATSASGSATAASQSATAAAQSATDATVAMKNKAPAIVQTASGDIASFDDGADGMPIKSMTVQIEPVQDGSGDPAPDNIRPITGRTSVTLTHTGKNLWNPADYAPLTLIDDPTDTYNGFYSGAIKAWANAYPDNHKGNYGRISMTATLGCAESAASGQFAFRFYFYYDDGTQDYDNNIIVEAGQVRTVTKSSTESKNCIGYAFSTSAGASNMRGRIKDAMVTLYGDDDTYEEPNVQIIPIAMPSEAGMVYGGILDPVDGVLTVTDGQIASYAGETLSGEWISDRDVYAPGTTPTTGAQVVYKLAEPVEYNLDHVTLTTLLGSNRIWADTGSVSVDYCADTKTYVDDAIPEIPEAPVQDVQVNGTSVVTNGVANVPTATNSRLGAVKGLYANGTQVLADGSLITAPATDAEIKSGSQTYKPVAPLRQHQSTFYGLSKAAGDSTQSASSNAVGAYTDEAKVAIQKMLGIYQAPWELIREDTGTNAESANVTISVDANGQPFELTDVYIEFWLPQQETDASVGLYGRMDFYYSDSGYFSSYSGDKTQAANTYPHGTFALLKNDNGAIYKVNGTYNTMGTDRVATSATGRVDANKSLLILNTNNYPFVKVVVNAITGTYQYRLYGKRKWN